MKKLLAVMLCLLAGFQVAAQDQSSPEAVMLRYAEATKSFDAAAITGLMHPEALRRFRATIDTSARKLRLTRGGDTTSIGAFDFEKPEDGSLILVGTFDALPTRLTLVV